MNLADLFRELERHDWFHAMSDDASVDRAGDANWNRLKSEADKIEGGPELMRAYSKHVFSGQSFGTPKAPKPECPNCSGDGAVAYDISPQEDGAIPCPSCNKEKP